MNILVATDGLECSRFAAVCCDLIDIRKRVAVKIVSVYEPQVPLAAVPLPFSIEYFLKLDELARNRAHNAAQSALEMILSQVHDALLEISITVELGWPSEIIIETAKKWNADLVILGSHGRGLWGRLALGSVSDAVVHHSPCSVLVVREKNREYSMTVSMVDASKQSRIRALNKQHQEREPIFSK